MGAEPGMRMALLVRPGIDFISLVFAMFKAGLVIVLIDPGMGRQQHDSLFAGIATGRVRGDQPGPSGTNAAASPLSEARLNVTVGRRWFWGGPTLATVA